MPNGEPLFFRALSHLPHLDRETQDADGFANITMDSDGGMAEILDRRPQVLVPAEAFEW